MSGPFSVGGDWKFAMDQNTPFHIPNLRNRIPRPDVYYTMDSSGIVQSLAANLGDGTANAVLTPPGGNGSLSPTADSPQQVTGSIVGRTGLSFTSSKNNFLAPESPIPAFGVGNFTFAGHGNFSFAEGSIFGYSARNDNLNGYEIIIGSSGLSLIGRHSPSGVDFYEFTVGAFTFGDDTWHSYGLTADRNSGVLSGYGDGSPTGSTSIAALAGLTLDGFTTTTSIMARRTVPSTAYSNGILAEWMYWKRKLSSQQMSFLELLRRANIPLQTYLGL